MILYCQIKLIYPKIIILVVLEDILASYLVNFGAPVSILTIFDSKFGLFSLFEQNIEIRTALNVFLYCQMKFICQYVIILLDKCGFLASYEVIFGAPVSILTIFDSKFVLLSLFEQNIEIQTALNVFLYCQMKFICQ